MSQYLDKWREEREAASAGKGKTYNSWKQDLGTFTNFAKWTGLSADELMAEALEDSKNARNRLLAWFNHKKESISFNASRTQMGTVRGFYSYNDIVFPKSFKQPQAEASKILGVYEGLRVWDEDKKTGLRTGLNDTIRQFMDNLSLTHRAFAMTVLATGAKAGVIARLNVGILRDAKGELREDTRIFLRTQRVKNRQPIAVFISQEATEILKRYYDQERKNAGNDEPLFIDERGDRMSSKAIQDAFGRAAKKLGVVNGENPLNPTRFRHIFKQAAISAGIGEDITAVMMGHKPKGEGMTYAGTDRGTILAPYIRIEKLLVVYGSQANSELKELRGTLNAVQNENLRQIEELKESLATQQKTIESLTKSVHSSMSVIMAMSEELGVEFEELFKKHFRTESK